MRGMAQGNTVTARMGAAFVSAVAVFVRDAIAAPRLDAGVRVWRVLWLRVGQSLPVCSSHQHRHAFAVSDLASVIFHSPLGGETGRETKGKGL